MNGSADVTLLNEAVHNTRSHALNQTIASSRLGTPSGSDDAGIPSRKRSVTSLTSAAFIAFLGLFTFGVLAWAWRHQEQRRAQGRHVLDGIQYAAGLWLLP